MHKRTSARVLALLVLALATVLRVAPVLAAPPSQVNVDVAGTWQSETYEDDNGEFHITLLLFPDNTLEAAVEYASGEDPYLEVGTWEDDGEGNVSVTVTGTPDEEYAEATTIEFVLDGDELLSEEFTAFSDDGFLLTKIDDEAVSLVGTVDEGAEAQPEEALGEEEVDAEVLDLPGIYVTGEIDAEGTLGGALIMLNEDGTAQGVAQNFDGGESVPSNHLGEWTDNDDGTLTITMTQKIVADGDEVGGVEDLDEAEPLVFEIVNGILVNELLNLYPVDEIEYYWAPDGGANEADAEEASAGIDGEVQMYMSSLDQIVAGNVVVLLLLADGTASLSATIGDSGEEIIELGTWEEGDDGVITLTMDRDGDENAYDEPYVLVLERDEDGNLIGTDYDVDRYGEALELEATAE